MPLLNPWIPLTRASWSNLKMQLMDHIKREGVFDQASRCRDEDEAVSCAVNVLVVGAERGAGHLEVGVGGARHKPEPDA